MIYLGNEKLILYNYNNLYGRKILVAGQSSAECARVLIQIEIC